MDQLSGGESGFVHSVDQILYAVAFSRRNKSANLHSESYTPHAPYPNQPSRQRALHRRAGRRAGAPPRLAVECAVCGSSWTTMEEAGRVAGMLGVGPGDLLLKIGAGSGWPGLYLAGQRLLSDFDRWRRRRHLLIRHRPCRRGGSHVAAPEGGGNRQQIRCWKLAPRRGLPAHSAYHGNAQTGGTLNAQPADL